MRNFDAIKDNNGMSILESVIAMGIGAAVMGGTMQMVYLSQKENKKMQIKMTALSLVNQFSSIVQDDVIWEATRGHGNDVNDGGSGQSKNTESFYCLDKTPHCTKAPRHFVLFSDSTNNSNITSKSSNPALRGLDLGGQPCTRSSVTGDDDCPYVFTLTYTPNCEGNNCAVGPNTRLKIEGKIDYKPGNSQIQVPFNPDRYKFTIFRASESGSQSQEPPPQDPPPPPPEMLVYGLKSVDHCTNFSGTVVTSGDAKFCRFNGASCPGGWSQYQNWSTTTENSISYYPHWYDWDQGCDPSGGQSQCKSGSHSWSNVAIETKTCTRGGCMASISSIVVSASRTQIGCY